jgi:hypothetical protein
MKRGVFEKGIEQPDQKVEIHTPVLSRQTLVERSGLTPLSTVECGGLTPLSRDAL